MNAPAPAPMRRPKETGVPENTKYLHPTLLKNYGNWKYHDRPRPGVLHHVSHSGDEVWSVRAGTARQMDVHTIRKLCSIADDFADGRVRFTIRSNIEFMVADESKVAPLSCRTGAQRLPGRRNRKFGDHDRPYPGLVALRYSRHRCFRCRQGTYG